MLACALSDASRSSTSTSIAALSASLLLLAVTTIPPLRQLLTVHSMDDMQADYNNYWETKCFLNVDDLDNTYYDSSLPDNGAGSSSGLTNEKGNIIMERNMRRKLNESLYTLRSVVPNITKINKASIIKDAIVHIQELQEEEKRLMAEVSVIQSRKAAAPSISKVEQSGSTVTTGGTKRRIRRAPRSPSSPSLQVVEVPMEGRV